MSSLGVCVTRGQLHTMKEQSVLMFSRTEAEEEGIINRLMKRLGDLKKEKETLLIEVRAGNPARGLSQFRLSDSSGTMTSGLTCAPPSRLLPLQVEREEELLTNTLQKRLTAALREKVRIMAAYLLIDTNTLFTLCKASPFPGNSGLLQPSLDMVQES